MPMTVLGHAGLHGGLVPPGEEWQHWTLDWSVLTALAGSAIAYGLVACTARRRSRGRAIGVRHMLAFAAGLAAVAVALASPVEALAGTLLSFHMAQHVLLVAVAPPLLAWGTPLARMAVGLPEPLRREARHAADGLARGRGAELLIAALVVHAVTLWAFHLRPLYQGALDSPALHAAEHVVFLVTATVFWWAILAFGARTRPSAATLGALFLLGSQGAALGALIAFASSPWYPAYTPGAVMWDVAPLADQQLAGLLMWGLGGLVPVCAGAALLIGWLERMHRFPTTLAPVTPPAFDTAREEGATSTDRDRLGAA